MSKTTVCTEVRQRDRIVDPGTNTVLLQLLLEFFPFLAWHSDDVQVIDRPDGIDLFRRHNTGPFQQTVISISISPAGFGPVFKVAELDAQDRGLQAVEPAIDSLEIVVVLLRT